MADRSILYRLRAALQGGKVALASEIETTGNSDVQTDIDAVESSVAALQQGEINAESFDNSYSSTLASTDLSSQEHFLSFTANPNTSGSNHSSVNATSDQNIDIDEEGYYVVSVSITVQNTSGADERLVPDISLYKRRSGVQSIRDERSGYIRASTNDATARAPTDLVFELDFEDALAVDDQVRLSIQARPGSVGVMGAVTSCTVSVRKVEFAGVTASVSNAQILQTINNLPSSNPNFYYERLRPGSGLATPSATHAIAATGDGTDFDVIPTRTSVGGILPDIPFENLFQGQMELQSDVDCSLEIEGRFTHFEGTANAFTTPRTLRIDLTANVPHTEELNGFNSEVAVPLGTLNLPGGGTLESTEELLAAPFPYRLEWRLKAFQLGSTTTRIAANISGFRLIANAIIFKQANRIIGPRGLAGPAGPSTTVAALASRDVLVEPTTPPSAAATAQSFTLTLPSGITSLTQYAFIEVGTSRSVDSQISYNLLSAATLVGATSSNPLFFFPTSGDAEYLGSTYSVYLSDASTLVFRAGANRGFLRVVRGINIGATSTPDTWNIQSQVVTPDAASGTNTALPSPTGQYDAFRINGDGFLRDMAVTSGDWLLALQTNADPNDLADWDIISGDRFPVSSTLFHFSDQITEQTVNNVTQFTLSDQVKIARDNLVAALQQAIDGTTPGGNTNQNTINSLVSKVDALFPLTPDVSDLTDFASVYDPSQTVEEVQPVQGYSRMADYRDNSTRYEQTGVTYDDSGANVVRYTGLTSTLFRGFGFKVTTPPAQVDTITLTGTSGTANLSVGGVNYLATFNTDLTTTAADFVTAHASALSTAGITVTSAAAVLTFTANVGGTAFAIVAPVNVSGDLAGTTASVTSKKDLLYTFEGSERIPYIDVTTSGRFRVNNYTHSTTAGTPVTNQIHFLTATGPTQLQPGETNTNSATVTPFPAGATSTSRALQVEFDVYLNGVNTQAGHIADIPLPASNTAQARTTASTSIFLGPLHQNRTVNITYSYELRVSGSDLIVDIKLVTAPSDVTISLTNVAALLSYTPASTTTRTDNFLTFTDTGGDYTFTGENELLITFQPHPSNNSTAVVAAVIGATGDATALNDRETLIPRDNFEQVEIPDDIDFRMFESNHFLRHSDLTHLLSRRNVQWVYGLAPLNEVRDRRVTEPLDFTQGIILTGSTNNTRVRLVLDDSNTNNLKLTLVEE